MISMSAYAVVLLGILLHHLIFPCGYEKRFSLYSLIRKKVHLFTLIFPEQKLSWPQKICKCIFMIGLLSFAVLAITGFGPLFFGQRLEGYLLMIHATFAPVFIGCAAIVAVLGAGKYAFSGKDAEVLSCRCMESNAKRCWLTDSGVGAKAGFWVLLVLSLPVTLTMVLSMLPLFGTDGQAFLFEAHRWCALAFALIAIVELYILIRMQILGEIHSFDGN